MHKNEEVQTTGEKKGGRLSGKGNGKKEGEGGGGDVKLNWSVAQPG